MIQALPIFLGSTKLPLTTLDDLATLPFTFKQELSADLHPHELAANLTYPLEHYVRYHRTSGTRGRPLVVLAGRQRSIRSAAELGGRLSPIVRA